jgi:hypothetical protein
MVDSWRPRLKSRIAVLVSRQLVSHARLSRLALGKPYDGVDVALRRTSGMLPYECGHGLSFAPLHGMNDALMSALQPLEIAWNGGVTVAFSS